MIGAFILFTVFICFSVSFSLGLVLTVFSFRKMSTRQNPRSKWFLWLTVLLGTLVVLIILVGVNADSDDSAQPSIRGYETMTRTLVLWAITPGCALGAAGIANLVRACRLPGAEE